MGVHSESSNSEGLQWELETRQLESISSEVFFRDGKQATFTERIENHLLLNPQMDDLVMYIQAAWFGTMS